MLQERKWFYAAFSALLFYALWQVWYPTYFVTGDGACHLHNAMVWKEMCLYKKSFYHNFYEWNKNLSPNYAGHIILAFLTVFVSPAVAEKILISIYMLSVCFGWLRLASCMKSKTPAFLLLIFPFLFQVFLFTGFYNYLLGIAGFLLLFSLYLKKENKRPHFTTLCYLSFFSLLLYFVHVMGFLMFVLCLFLHVGYKSLNGIFQKEKRIIVIREAVAYFIVLIPGLCALFFFNQSQKGGGSNYSSTFNQLFQDLLYWKSLVTFKQTEVRYLHGLFIFLFLYLFLITLYSFIRNRYSHKQQLVSLWLLALSFLYFYYPDSALGGEMIKFRFQTMIFLFLLLLVSLYSVSRWFNLFLGIGCFLFSTGFIYMKQEGIKRMSKVVSEIRHFEPFIENNSFILPLSFHTAGIYSEKEISEEVHYSTNHLAEYLHDGSKKLVFTDNYEANTNYFPLIWKPEMNPFPYFPKAESQPPEVDLSSYHRFHYVLIFNLTPKDRLGRTYKKIFNQLKHGFHKVEETPTAVLYRRNTKGLPY